MMEDTTSLLVWGIIAHLVADWLFQNEWMVTHKTSLMHPAAWTHGAIHALLLMLLFPWPIALLVGVIHMLIDTRIPVRWWMRVVKQMPGESALTLTIEIWVDQVFHITVLALTVLLLF